ncbi:MAG TPA: prenyltransferase/squalene oxidase repeat-containing protein [Planctomycetota bacterium]|nr:prenyltransferase/squalene oxidase repeat-containing protein [Planctomycetota bacterium]HRR82420.1 prenyltransferase/squalene oxidase repeat-containing protein [Planctomycetota bacterium]HRT93102.1 prenyltransferase/squalene oxidase repeat-containing protein [Planctomycetota bacterium]
MTLREGMLEAARRAPRLLGDSCLATAAFLRAQQNPDGGFRGRGSASDLYYTAFAVQGLAALGEPPEPGPLRRYLASFGGGEDLDLVHLACLARCWAALPGEDLPWVGNLREACRQRIEAHRSTDGGYGPAPGAEHGTAYGCFFALGALEDMNLPQVSNLREVADCLAALRRDDGSYANERPLRSGTTPATAAAVSVLKQLGRNVEPATVGWLLARAAPEGGFFATAAAPLPDLLSTATALHALDGLGELPAGLRQACVAFVESLRTEEGGYLGLALDEEPDAEYTFYALLALGHLGGSAA